MDGITVLYSCPQCGIKDAEVRIPYRESGQDIMLWFNGAVASIGRDHSLRSPHCHPEKLHDLKIPMPAGTKLIGGPVVN